MLIITTAFYKRQLGAGYDLRKGAEMLAARIKANEARTRRRAA